MAAGAGFFCFHASLERRFLHIGFGAAAAARAGGAGRRQGAEGGVTLAEGKEKLDKKPIEDEDQDTKAAKKDTAPGTTNMTL